MNILRQGRGLSASSCGEMPFVAARAKCRLRRYCGGREGMVPFLGRGFPAGGVPSQPGRLRPCQFHFSKFLVPIHTLLRVWFQTVPSLPVSQFQFTSGAGVGLCIRPRFQHCSFYSHTPNGCDAVEVCPIVALVRFQFTTRLGVPEVLPTCAAMVCFNSHTLRSVAPTV